MPLRDFRSYSGRGIEKSSRYRRLRGKKVVPECFVDVLYVHHLMYCCDVGVAGSGMEGQGTREIPPSADHSSLSHSYLTRPLQTFLYIFELSGRAQKFLYQDKGNHADEFGYR
jgi:hypothetical protein